MTLTVQKRLTQVSVGQFLLVVALMCFSVSLYASEYGTQEFSPLFPLLAQLSDRNNPVNEEMQASIDHIETLFSEIEKQLNERSEAPPRGVSAAIVAYRTELLRALASPDIETVQTILANIADDADLKWKFLSNTSGFSAFERPLLIKVTVTTVRGSLPEPGYTVTCNPFRDAAQSVALFPFSSETNHATTSIPPGRYRLQLYKGKHFILSKDIRIGVTRDPSEEVIVDVENY